MANTENTNKNSGQYTKTEIALSEGLIAFSVSGIVSTKIISLGSDERLEGRERRRKLVLFGIRRLEQAFGISQAIGVTEPIEGETPEVWENTLRWLAAKTPAVEVASGFDRGWVLDALGQALVFLRQIRADDKTGRDEVSGGMIRSVIRALCEDLAADDAIGRFDVRKYVDLSHAVMTAPPPGLADPEAELMKLAVKMGTASSAHSPLAQEAIAGLTRLARWHSQEEGHPTKGKLAPSISISPALMVSIDGPYLLQGSAEVVNHLGVPVDAPGVVAFCRCGQSSSKPYCDGSHATLGFSGDKDPRRIPDARDVYVGQQATVFDNRGLCAHSGFCTDRLNGVFHVGQEPFVTPSGGRLDEIMRAARRCPSGALSVGIHGEEMRQFVDESRPPKVEISKDGPYRITGSIPLIDERGLPVARDAGSSDEHYSLCRCGSSLNKPFCSGMHWSVAFKDPVPAEDWEPTLFEWAGGYPALLEMTTIFYSKHVPSDPLVGPLFARMEADHPERVAAWLSEVFGGPSFYSERYGGYARMISQHLDKHLTQEQRSHWATLMAQSADEAGLPNDAEFRAAFMAYIEWGSRIAVENSTAGAKPPPNMPVPRWWWVCNAKPGARVSAVASLTEDAAEAETPTLAMGERPTFEKHVKGLFRKTDRNSMKFAFDLWAYEDVKKNAHAILDRVRAGTMPCDGAWPPAKVEVFEQWVEGGLAE